MYFPFYFYLYHFFNYILLTKFYFSLLFPPSPKVYKDNTPEYQNGNLHEALLLDILNYDKALSILEPKWKSVDVLVVMNVVPYAPLRFVENLFKFGSEVVKMHGTIFVTGSFKSNGALTPLQEKLDMRLRTMSARCGIRDLDDVIAVAKTYLFHLDLKFEMEEGNVALIFKKTPPFVRDEKKVEDKDEEKKGEKGEKGRGDGRGRVR